MDPLVTLVLNLTENYQKIIHINDIKKHKKLYWGGNGVGDRWCNKKFNYSIIAEIKKLMNYS